ncbi:MAG TPA: glycosyltransferase family 4 protein [Polyangiaceae bacterium]|nr:glycosyltransferase family 4 protein [Polyangiaceae bacterium]
MAEALRIAWVVYGSLEQISGGYIYDRLVVEELRRSGDNVTVISLEPGATQVSPISAADYDVLVGDELCFRELLPLFQHADAPHRVLLIHHLTAWEHPPGAERERLLALEKAVIDAADVCVATSRVTADRLHAEQIALRTLVAEPGADRMERPETAGQEPSGARLRLLFIGNLLRRKRVLELCRAFGSLSTSSVELVLVGAELEPDYASEVRLCVEQHGVRERVRFLGPLSAADVADQLALADTLVLPSALEGYGMVLSEALWASVPVIAARVGAAEQLVGLTGAGLLYEPDDDAALGATLGAFVADARLRWRLRQAAWQAAEMLPRWRDTARALRATLVSSLITT